MRTPVPSSQCAIRTKVEEGLTHGWPCEALRSCHHACSSSEPWSLMGATDWLEIRLSLCDFAGDRRFLCDPLAPIFYLGRVKVKDLGDSIV